MMQVKWIKICTDVFDDEKIVLIESMPEADGIIAMWFKILCLAGKQNNGGVLMLNDRIAYTDEMLSVIFRRPLNTVRLAMQTFESFGMIEVVRGAYTIPNWDKHQNEEKMTAIREYNREAQRKSRERKKLLTDVIDVSMTSQECQGTEEDKEEELENRNKKKDIKKPSFIDVILSEIADDDLRNLYYEYIAMRKAIKSPITTERALKMLINKVNELEPNDISRKKKLLENAIVGNWKSVYPLKEEPKNETQTASYNLDAYTESQMNTPIVYRGKKK